MKAGGERPPKAIELQMDISKLQSEKERLAKSMKSSRLGKKEFRQKTGEIDIKIAELEQFLKLLETTQGKEDEIEKLDIEMTLIKAQKDCLVQLARKDKAKPEVLQTFRERLDSHSLQIRAEQHEQMLPPKTEEKDA